MREIKKGTILIDVDKHRYIKSGNLFFPCIKVDDFHFKIKSVLAWEMVEHRLQNAIDIHADFVTDLL